MGIMNLLKPPSSFSNPTLTAKQPFLVFILSSPLLRVGDIQGFYRTLMFLFIYLFNYLFHWVNLKGISLSFAMP